MIFEVERGDAKLGCMFELIPRLGNQYSIIGWRHKPTSGPSLPWQVRLEYAHVNMGGALTLAQQAANYTGTQSE